MSAEKPLYQPWSEEAFRSSIHVQAMTPVQRWMYRTLLQAAFCESTRPYLPNDNDLLWKLAGCENKEQWDSNKSVILKQFKVIESGELLENSRVTGDWLKLLEFRETRSVSGRKGAETRWNVGPMAEPSSAIAKDGKEVKEVNIRKLSKAQYTETKIDSIWESITGFPITQPKDSYKKELKELVRIYGEEQILSQFEIWATLNSTQGFKRPVSAFIKQFSGTASATRTLFSPSDINNLAVKLSLCSGGEVTFNRLNLNGLAQLLTEFTQDEIISAFKRFYSNYTGDKQWAAKNFIEEAYQHTMVARKQKADQIRKEQEIQLLKTQLQSEAASTMANNEAQEVADERLAEEALQFLFGDDNGCSGSENEFRGLEEETGSTTVVCKSFKANSE